MISNKKNKFAIVLGARPNFIKVAPFLKRAKKYPQFDFFLIHTGQHFDDNMSRIFFEEMGIPKPDVNLNVRGELHTEKIGKMFNELNRFFQKNKFDGVIVFGDVNSTLAGAIAAVKNNLKLIHVEAGLRSHDRRMPEEINRVIVDHLSDLLFTSELSANENLKKEGIEEEKIKYVGNIMIESIEIFWDKIQASKILETLRLRAGTYFVATIHRQENIDDKNNLEQILFIFKEINNHKKIIFPLHPGTRKKVYDYGLQELLDDMTIIEPLGYFEFTKLMADSAGVITDSGGIQEETTHLGIPCCTLRENTERPITLTLGSNKLFPIKKESVEAIKEHLDRKDFKTRHIPLCDAMVSKRIFDYLKQIFYVR